MRVEGSLASLMMYEGRFDEAGHWAERAVADAKAPGVPAGLGANLRAMLGVIHLRRGETENCLECLGPSSCIFPIAAEAIHQKTSGSRVGDPTFSRIPSASGPRMLGSAGWSMSPT